MTWGYDLDGVLGMAPPAPLKPWGRMTGPERRRRDEELASHFRVAPVLYRPKQTEFFVVTARPSRWHGPTSAWLAEHFSPVLGLFLFPKGIRKTYDSVALFKSAMIRTATITDFAEDDKTVVRLMRRELGSDARIWLFEDGELKA